MAKHEVERLLGAASALDVKQNDVALLLKKKQQDDDTHKAHSADAQDQASSSDAAPASSDSAQTPTELASADGVYATDAGSSYGEFAAAESHGGLSTGAWVGIGVAAVGAGVLIYEATKSDNNNDNTSGVSSIDRSSGDVNEGQPVTFVLHGAPGSVFTYTLSGPGITASDIEGGQLTGQVTIGSDGTAAVTVTPALDGVSEGNETLTFTAGGQTQTVTIHDVNPPQSLALTTGQDNIDLSNSGAADTVTGIVDPAGVGTADDRTTFSAGDVIQGNGQTILELQVESSGTAEFAQVSDVARIDLVAGTTGAVILNGVSWHNVGEIDIARGIGGMGVFATSLELGTDLRLAADVRGGAVAASYTDGSLVGIFNSARGGGSVVSDGGPADLTVNVENSQSGFMFAGPANTAITTIYPALPLPPPGNITVGDMTGVGGDNAFVGAFGSASGDLTYGNVDLTVGNSASATASMSATGDVNGGNISVAGGNNASLLITVNAPSGNIDVGDLSLTAGNWTATPTFSGHFHPASINVYGSHDVTVGNVDMTVGNASATTSATAHVFVSMSAGTGGNGGNLTVGDITVSGGNDVEASVSLEVTSGTNITVGDIAIHVGDVQQTPALAFGTGNASALLYINDSSALAGGSVTVGNVDMAVGLSGYLSFTAYLSGIGGTTQGGDLGDLTVGNIALDLGQNASGSVSIEQYQSAATTNGLGMGSLTVGDIDVNLDADASLSIEISQTLTGTSGGPMGDFTVGNLNATLGIGASLTYNVSAYNFAGTALGTGASENLGNITVGDFVVAGDDAAFVSASRYFSATSGSIGDVSFGNVDVAVGVGGSVFDYGYAYAFNGGNIGDISVGDLSYTLGKSAVGSMSYSFSASSGSLGNVTIGDLNFDVGQSASWTGYYMGFFGSSIASVVEGDLTINVAKSALFSDPGWVTFSATNGDIGSVTVGDVSIQAATSATIYDAAGWYIHAAGDIGSVEFGDYTVGLNNAFFTDVNTVSITATNDIGTVSFGNIAIEMTGQATMDLFTRNIAAGHDIDSVTFGDVSLVAHSDTGTAATLNFTVSAGHDIGSVTIGDVNLTADNSSTQNLSAVFNLTAANSFSSVDVGVVTLGYTQTTGFAPGSVNFTLNASAAATDPTVHIGGFVIDATLTGTAAIPVVTNVTQVLSHFNVNAGSGNVTIDLIDVNVNITSTATGANANAEASLYDLTNILANVNTTGTITLGTVDYSDYVYNGLAATPTLTIDVRPYNGDITIIGSAGNDHLIANTTAVAQNHDTLTGGDGADIFDFTTGNAPTSQAAVDIVTDFVHASDVIHFTGAAPTANQYFEGTYASFAAFIADANAHASDVDPDYLIAGQVGNDVFVAYDQDQNGVVDMVIELQNVNINTLNFGDYTFN